MAIASSGLGDSPASLKRIRRGFTLVEMIGTCLLLGAMLSMTVPMVLLVARERQTVEQRQFAVQHAANLLEIVSSRHWSELTAGEMAIPEADADLSNVLPNLERSVVVKNFDSTPEARQITALIRWRNPSGQVGQPIRLSTWVYARKEKP